jgi:crotonobetainyl-CoA:carnitine CoA-transferase CaiB-like acyl-CoA transferase
MAIGREMTMETVSTEQGTENMEYVRRLLRQKQPGFSTALELAVAGVERELLSAAVPPGGFARDFGTADGKRVMVAALTQQQFADLAMTTRLARTFAFLGRLLLADFSAIDDLHTHRDTIAVLLAPWFSRRTVADLAAAFAGTSVPWARLHNLAGRPDPDRPVDMGLCAAAHPGWGPENG